MEYDVLVIGGGPAGLAAALEVARNDLSVVIIEREHELGGILNQCIHNGFGLHYFKEELTGPEYADRFVRELLELNKLKRITILTDTMVTAINDVNNVTACSADRGILNITVKAIILATGCRERGAGAIGLCGSRPSGVMTAGFAQKLTNTKGYLPGKKIVILGSGDIGLIMARRMTYEGAEVKAVVEIMQYSSGLKRNIAQCLEDNNIPLLYSHTVTRLLGYPRLTGVCIAPVNSDNQPILNQERLIECDCLLLSVGLIPETELLNNLDIDRSESTKSYLVNNRYATACDNIFMCGNVLHVHDLVDNVSLEGESAGRGAVEYIKYGTLSHTYYNVLASGDIRYALPQRIVANTDREVVKIYYRSNKVLRNADIIIRCRDKIILKTRKSIISPGEMESLSLDSTLINGDIIIDTVKGD